MDTNTIAHLKQKLEGELVRLEGELRELGWENEQGAWEASAGEIDSSATQQDELADRIEEFEERGGEMDALELQWKNVKRALEKIETGEYGICEVSGEEIEADRLEANPSARTCVLHMDDEASLDA
jgi:RNA polymerase-binding transcription factor DksA